MNAIAACRLITSAACKVVACVLAAGPSGAFAQTIDSMGINKTIVYVQTSASSFAVNSGSPYNFNAQVRGTGLSSLSPAPVVSGPIDTILLGSSFNNGVLTYDPQDSAWLLNRGYDSAAALDARFGSGTYTITVNGTAVPVQLAGDAYPNAPLVTLTGGAWSNGKYYFDPARPLTITTNAFADYSTYGGVIFLGWGVGNGDQHSGNNPANSMSVTVPANSYAAGQELALNIQFSSFTNNNQTAIPGTFAAAAYNTRTSVPIVAQPPPQVFPMTVTSTIGAVTSNATAQIQPRPQDVGSTASVFVFAVAPSNRVLNAAQNKAATLAWRAEGASKDTPVQCVLAQLNSSGQLTAVSASSLQAYVTGTLSAQAQAITILNGVPTANIGGATFYVGYGANAGAMINNGINQRALSVSGDITCDPQAPETGWWWNTAEGGRGYSIEVAGNHIFYASYLYDVTGRATWLVASGNTSLDGSLFTGNLEAYSLGQTLSSAYRAPTALPNPGALTLAFNDARHGTMTWPGGSVAIERFNIVPDGLSKAAQPGQPEGGWWFNPSESGRGFFMEWQGGELFMAGYMYDDNGNPVWYLSSNSTPSTNLQSYQNSWGLYGNGQTLTSAYKPAQQVNANVGAVSITFQGSENAIMTLPGGRTTAIRRFRF